MVVAGAASPASVSNHAGARIPIGGNGFIAGTGDGLVTAGGLPARKRIFLYDKITMKCISSTVSDENGAYRFSSLNVNRRYVVTAYDATLRFNALIRDNIQPAIEP